MRRARAQAEATVARVSFIMNVQAARQRSLAAAAFFDSERTARGETYASIRFIRPDLQRCKIAGRYSFAEHSRAEAMRSRRERRNLL